ncbi:MAG: hypothetical protein QOD26_2315 [Betaproteobacteria bacterium]|jgi:hypothetical protein|nr:hypothetical protein [Betaproteobacteria bacterium]
MHLQLDDEIVQIEKRIAGRKTQITRVGKETSRRTLDGLASPVTLAGALALGFAVGGRMGRRRPPERRHERAARAKATGIAGLLVSGAMWFVRAQYGSPMGLAQVLIQKFQHRKAPREYPAREFPPRV